ncbi:MAG: folate-binding protein [Caulobacter sp.]|nr:folate-binding protein [Caulobacter sp.]
MTDTPIFAELKSRALVSVSGDDWRTFLQGLVTQDVETLAAGELRHAALLSPQGRLLFDLLILGRNDGCWLDVAADRREALIPRLLMYRLRARVEIAPLEQPVSALFPAPRDGVGAPGFVPDPRLPALGLRGYGAAPPAGVVIAEEAAWEAHRLALGVPEAADFGEDKTFPIEANFDLTHGIDFKKGCFVGQETTSRMKRRGQIKSRMLPIAFDGPPPAFGAEVLAGELRAGQVLSGGPGRSMALLRLDRIEGATLTVDGRPVTVERPDWLAA